MREGRLLDLAAGRVDRGVHARVGAGSAGSLTVAGRESAAAPRRPVRLSPESMMEDAFVAMGARPRGSDE